MSWCSFTSVIAGCSGGKVVRLLVYSNRFGRGLPRRELGQTLSSVCILHQISPEKKLVLVMACIQYRICLSPTYPDRSKRTVTLSQCYNLPLARNPSPATPSVNLRDPNRRAASEAGESGRRDSNLHLFYFNFSNWRCGSALIYVRDFCADR